MWFLYIYLLIRIQKKFRFQFNMVMTTISSVQEFNYIKFIVWNVKKIIKRMGKENDQLENRVCSRIRNVHNFFFVQLQWQKLCRIFQHLEIKIDSHCTMHVCERRRVYSWKYSLILRCPTRWTSVGRFYCSEPLRLAMCMRVWVYIW